MSEVASRRELLKMSLAGAAALATPAALYAQSVPIPSVDEVEKQLGHPLPDEAQKLLKAALEANQKNGTDRLVRTLPEGSEPCFVYRPTEVNYAKRGSK